MCLLNRNFIIDLQRPTKFPKLCAQIENVLKPRLECINNQHIYTEVIMGSATGKSGGGGGQRKLD